ncbi:hypothetical protein BDS110ZK4_30240 [Bradyrhizobium diazoefficiens]|uniref:Uncharacterized protein n=1 Tax=Bradyrhizobium diazoefficiens TaxID=1355477 RepID=A0A810CWE5_9BRAD|nr:hypothetical protein XF4B_45030 [Bradyrhizobium diazoefficiens]BCE91670.1 hypothetical protein XF10B_44680 [Bradyrhizobium diazoefficiens]
MFRKQAPSNPDVFVSAKTLCAIPARHDSLREALVQNSLDPQVRSIGYLASAYAASQPVDLGAVVVSRDDGRYVLDVVPARRIRDLDEEGLVQIALRELGLSALTITADDIRQEPRYANAQLVWSYNGVRVPIGLRMRIIEVLIEDGPMALGRLLSSISADRDPSPAVMALACADLVELDLLSEPIGPRSIVRARS